MFPRSILSLSTPGTARKNALLTALMLSGFDGVTKPALAVRAANK